MASLRCAAWLLPAFFLLGCGEQHFRAETVWHADGRVERAVYQPAEYFPESAHKGWEVIRSADEFSSDAFAVSIRELPESSDEPRHLAAWGRFLSPDALPDHVLISTEVPGKAGRLERTAEVRRLGLATEYVWRERLTDVVSFADMHAARRETATITADLVEATLRDGTLKHDISGLLRWLRTDAPALLDETHGLLVEAAVRRELEGAALEKLAERLADAAAERGLNLRTADGKIVDGNELDDAFDRFLVAKVRETVREPSGEHVDGATARGLLAKLGLAWDGSSLSWQPTECWRRAVTARFGTEDAAKAKAAELMVRLFGVYNAGILTPKRPFRYEMTVPGSIVETTGERIAEGRVVWRFEAAEAFPLGYDMAVRSLAPNESAQKAVFGSVRLKSVEQLSEYSAIVKGDPGLAGVMERCVEAAALKPLDDYVAEIENAGGADPAVAGRVERLRKLLAR